MRLHRESERIWIEGNVAHNRRHRHHAMQIVWASQQAPAELRWKGGQLRGQAILVDGGESHALDLRGGLVCLIERQSPIARQLRTRWLAGAPVAAAPPSPRAPAFVHAPALLAELTVDAPATSPLDTRIETVLAWMQRLENEQRWSSVSLAEARMQTHLSASRFLHLFSQQLGTPWRSYLVWRRALVAIALALEGESLTQAAMAAGYADSAHLARQFASLFGVAPSIVVHDSQFVQSSAPARL